VLRAGAWAARGLRVPARNALLADIVPASVYGRAYGFERAMDNLGAIAGPLLALAPVELRGSAFGLLAAVQSFGNLAASAIAGLLWTLASPRGGLRLPGRLDAARPRWPVGSRSPARRS
jgi:hypothetical protein